jgi:hypothetical protein
MSLVDAEFLDLLEGTSGQQLSHRTSSDTATGASLTASEPRMAKQAIWVLAMIMHPFLSSVADGGAFPSSVRVACKQTVDALRLWISGAGRLISASCSISIHQHPARLEVSRSLLDRSIF